MEIKRDIDIVILRGIVPQHVATAVEQAYHLSARIKARHPCFFAVIGKIRQSDPLIIAHLHRFRAPKHRMLLPETDHRSGKLQKLPVSSFFFPVDPPDRIILAVRVIVAFL